MRRFFVVFLLLLMVVALVAVASFASRYSSDKDKLVAARDEVLPTLQAIMAELAEEKRPVLRGEPISGSGAGKLDSVFDKITDVPKTSRVRWPRLFREMYDGTLSPEQAEIARAHLESMRAFLPEAREALQHESCYLSEDLTAGLHSILANRSLQRRNRAGFRLAAAWLLEAEELAGAGRRDEALRCLADTIRLGEELGPRGRLSFKWYPRDSIQDAAAVAGSGLLRTHPFKIDELDAFLDELSILEESQAGLLGTLEVIEFMAIIELADAWEKGRTRYGPRGRYWWLAYLSGEYDVAEFRQYFNRERELYLGPIQKMRQAGVQTLNSREGSAFVMYHLGQSVGIREAELEVLARLRCLRAATMVHRYRAAHGGTWPAALGDCGDEPIDPWDGKPLRYKPPDGGRPACIYSVGVNLIDEGGVTEEPFKFKWRQGRRKAHDDFIFPLGRWLAAEGPEEPPR
ncbi:MAG: hypothetical protein O7H41_15385 [Planctomycetota bacterium]|nr:hypothetical protein [Planctomycetota bacterium]